LFTDGEDYGDFSDTTETLLGARYFAAHLPAGYQPLYAVLWDMVGDKDLDISIEANSRAFETKSLSTGTMNQQLRVSVGDQNANE